MFQIWFVFLTTRERSENIVRRPGRDADFMPIRGTGPGDTMPMTMHRAADGTRGASMAEARSRGLLDRRAGTERDGLSPRFSLPAGQHTGQR
jgi:hypothetical protein